MRLGPWLGRGLGTKSGFFRFWKKSGVGLDFWGLGSAGPGARLGLYLGLDFLAWDLVDLVKNRPKWPIFAVE